MKRKFKNIISLLLLMAFLLPSIARLEHHHEHFICHAKNEKHFHDFHEKCSICDFEFSAFALDFINIVLSNELPVDNYRNQYSSLNKLLFPKYSFSLRAPPYLYN